MKKINIFGFCCVATFGILLIGDSMFYSHTNYLRNYWTKEYLPRALLLHRLHRFSTHSCNDSITNIALIKTHKTGSTTLAHIVDRFGFSRNLSFLLPVDVRYGRGFVWDLDSPVYGSRDFRLHLRSTGSLNKTSYNLFTLHSTYNRQVMDNLMKSGTKYITSVRDPVEQFESAFVHYKFYLALPETFQDEGIKLETKIEEWLRLPWFYKDKYKTIIKEERVKKAFSELYCHNSQMRDLGFDMKNQENNEVILEYVSILDQQFNFVVITEYFDESLLILKKELCWKFDDILYVPENQRS